MQRLNGMCVNTIVLISPPRFESHAATGNENAESRFDQKKNTLACASDRSKRSNSHSASSDCTTKPPANESMLNSAASLITMPREGPSTAGLVAEAAIGRFGMKRYNAAASR